jgi:hypothetical protein
MVFGSSIKGTSAPAGDLDKLKESLDIYHGALEYKESYAKAFLQMLRQMP